MQYLNLNKNFAEVMSDDKIFTKNQLIKNFEDFIASSGYKVQEWLDTKCAPYKLIISNESKTVRLHIYLKNITGAGWSDKPHIKRVQVSNIKKVSIENYVSTSELETLIILGYYNFDDNPLMAGWDAYRYVEHETMRSCYVNVATLKRGYLEKYLTSVNASQKIWVFDASHFGTFLDDYISYQRSRGV